MSNQTTNNIIYIQQDFINMLLQTSPSEYIPTIKAEEKKKPVTIFKMVKKEGTGGA